MISKLRIQPANRRFNKGSAVIGEVLIFGVLLEIFDTFDILIGSSWKIGQITYSSISTIVSSRQSLCSR